MGFKVLAVVHDVRRAHLLGKCDRFRPRGSRYDYRKVQNNPSNLARYCANTYTNNSQIGCLKKRMLVE